MLAGFVSQERANPVSVSKFGFLHTRESREASIDQCQTKCEMSALVGRRLYNLSSDIGESNDLSKVRLKKVAEFDALLELHILDTSAVVQLSNSRFDPDTYRHELVGFENIPETEEKK